jgi:hypothetical protein
VTVGLHMTPSHKYSWNGGPLVPGITTVQGMKDKSNALVGWAKREVAAVAVRNVEMLGKMVEEGGRDSALTWLKSQPDFQRDSSAGVGTRVHAALETIGRGGEPEMDADVEPFVASWRRDFLAVHRPVFRSVEFRVYSEKHQYGGTGDLAAEIGPDLWLLDYKSGSGIYADTALQLAALRWADWVGIEGDPKKYRIPQATRFGVVHVRPEQTVLREYRVTETDFRAFLACRELYRWTQEVAPHVMGDYIREKAAA